MKESWEISDESLMKRYVDGDSVAFDVLFGRYERRAYAFFFHRTRSDDRAEDLYQELFLRIHRNRHSYDPRRPFSPWFFQIARRLLIDDFRRSFRSLEVQLREEGTARADFNVELRLQNAERVEHLLSRLTPEERHVLVSAKVGGVGYAELAKELGKSADAVKKMASRAMQRLRTSTSTEDPPCWARSRRLHAGQYA